MGHGKAIRQRILASSTGLDEGHTSRIVRKLLEAGLVNREESGISVPDSTALLDAWRDDYRFDRHHVVRGHIASSRLLKNSRRNCPEKGCNGDKIKENGWEVEGVRGRREPQVSMLAFIDLETRVPAGHPLRTIKGLADRALAQLSPEFDRMYAQIGRPSIPPERLLKASLLISLYSVRSERGFCEQLDYNLLFRWFLGMNLMEPSFDPTVFTKNRERLLKHRVGQALFDEVVLEADRRGLLSDEHFTVDGTLIEAAASLKSFKPKDGDPPKTTR